MLEDVVGRVVLPGDEQVIGHRFGAGGSSSGSACLTMHPFSLLHADIVSAARQRNDFAHDTIVGRLERVGQWVSGLIPKCRPCHTDLAHRYNVCDERAALIQWPTDTPESSMTSNRRLWGDPSSVTMETVKSEPSS